jgi:RNA polymerase sigma-70 factor (ECF subfamily)
MSYERKMIVARAPERIMAGESDDELVAAARQGDVESFGALYERYKGPVFAFVLSSLGRREDAEDAVQDTFCRAWRAMGSFRGEAKLLTWLMRIAANACAEQARRDRRKRRLGIEVDLDIDEVEHSAGSLECDSIRRQAAREALDALSMPGRMLVVLCDIQGFTCVEAARSVGCSAISARVRLCRARKRLRELLAPMISEVD